jgi:hypothetical protein
MTVSSGRLLSFQHLIQETNLYISGVSKINNDLISPHAVTALNKPKPACLLTFHIPINVIYILFSYRSNQTKYDLAFLEAHFFQSYHGLIHHVGSPPVIGILSYAYLSTAVEAIGNPINPAFISDILFPFGHRMTFYERLKNTVYWLWFRWVHLVQTVCPYCRRTTS